MVEILRAFKSRDANGNGDPNDEILFATRGGESKYISWTFVNPFGVTNEYHEFYPQDGKVLYGPIDPRFEDALIFVNDLYEEGLIDQEFATVDGKMFDAKNANNRIGAYNYWFNTAGEKDRMNTIMQDIQTYKFETVLKFMMGTEPLSTFDEYVQKIRDMGIDEVLAIQQKRYDELVNE